ncbi:MAG: glucose-1-phosphate thymidylyltransferase [Candidatus Aenigmarchaeota archaeon]|nr:glucose-1-phosphate thymidylyltransferase [Candidatus Aenigmarchaeota archaeon]
MKGLILAGGLGKRLRPLTHTGPKQLIPIANKPVLHYVIEDLVNAGIKEIGIVVGYTDERIQQIKDSAGNGSKWGADITYIRQSGPLGLAHAVKTAQTYLGIDDFVVYLGDNMLKSGIKEFVNEFENSDAAASILVTEVKNPGSFGVAELDANGRIIGVEEKPAMPKSNRAIVGVYLFKTTIFQAIDAIEPSRRGELEITNAIQKLIELKKKIISHEVSGWWDDTGNVDDVLHANHMVLNDLRHEIKGTIMPEAKIIGIVNIGENSIVENGAVIRGPVIIGNNCKICNETYIGPYTSVGDNTIIKNSEIESSIIMGDSEIDTGSQRIMDSLIGRHVKIKTNANMPKAKRLVLGENSEVML